MILNQKKKMNSRAQLFLKSSLLQDTWVRVLSAIHLKLHCASFIHSFAYTSGITIIAHEGWLTKLGQVFKTWKRRYFVLELSRERRVLKYYRDIEQDVPSGEMLLTEYTVVQKELVRMNSYCWSERLPIGVVFVMHITPQLKLAFIHH